MIIVEGCGGCLVGPTFIIIVFLCLNVFYRGIMVIFKKLTEKY